MDDDNLWRSPSRAAASGAAMVSFTPSNGMDDDKSSVDASSSLGGSSSLALNSTAAAQRASRKRRHPPKSDLAQLSDDSDHDNNNNDDERDDDDDVNMTSKRHHHVAAVLHTSSDDSDALHELDDDDGDEDEDDDVRPYLLRPLDMHVTRCVRGVDVLLGRGHEGGFPAQAVNVSRQHLVLRWTGEDYVLCEQVGRGMTKFVKKSKGGVEKVLRRGKTVKLRHGDVLVFGKDVGSTFHTELRFPALMPRAPRTAKKRKRSRKKRRLSKQQGKAYEEFVHPSLLSAAAGDEVAVGSSVVPDVEMHDPSLDMADSGNLPPESDQGKYALALPILPRPEHKYDAAHTAFVTVREVYRFLRTHPAPELSLTFVVYPEDDSEVVLAIRDLARHESRVKVVDADGGGGASSSRSLSSKLTTLNSSEDSPCFYVLAPTNWRFKVTGKLMHELHSAATPWLTNTSLAQFRTASSGQCLWLELPRMNPLRVNENVHYVLQVVPPNMNPRRPDCLEGNYDEGDTLLTRCYQNAFERYYQLTRLPPPSKLVVGDGASESVDANLPPWITRLAPDVEEDLGLGASGPSSADLLASLNLRGGHGGSSSSAAHARSSLNFALQPVPEYEHPGADAFHDRGHWKSVFNRYAQAPSACEQVTYWRDDTVMVVYDKYPKARVHLVMFPLRNVSALSLMEDDPDDIALLTDMQNRAEWIADGLTTKYAPLKLEFRCGYHAVPSLQRLHMHIISQDFDSPCLKNKKHWNSFTTAFFIDSPDALAMARAGTLNELAHERKRHFEAMLKQPLRCHRCKEPVRTLPALKKHIDKCRPEG